MSFENLIEQYGYWMVAAGTVIEGSTTVISSAFLAHRGYLNLGAVWSVATTATFVEGVALYEIARGRGTALAHNADAKSERIQKVLDWVKRRGVVLLLVSRFLFGVRTAVALACGVTHMPRGRYLAANLAGAVLWTSVVVAIGYSSGHAFTLLVSDVKRHEWTAFACIALVVFTAVLFKSRGRDFWDLIRAVGRG